jgi:fumarate hydratase class I
MTHTLKLPLSDEQVRELKAGDVVLLSGTIHTGRDAVHRHLHSGGTLPCDLRNGIIYHCGPIIIRERDSWKVTAAGPTTSIREEPYMADLIAQYRFRAIIGKGGMGPRTLAACAQYGCVYLSAVGGAAQRLAKAVKKVNGVTGYDEFGAPEAVWELLVEDFPAMVTMDTHGTSLHSTVKTQSEERLAQLLEG